MSSETDFSFEVRNVSVQRGPRVLIEGFDLSVRAGQAVHLIGPNGCGKTSLMRVMAGLVAPLEGELLWCGRPVHRVLAAFQQNMAWLGHHAGLKGDLTLLENLHLDNALRRGCSSARVEAVLEQLNLAGRRSVLARGLSAGQRRRLALARVLLSDAPLWLLDEPLTNLDTEGRSLVLDLMSQHVATGGSCIFAAHQSVELDKTTVRRLEWGV